MNFLQITTGIGETKDGIKLTPEQVNKGLMQARELIAVTFGGYTEIDTQGGWMHEGRIVTEPGKTFQVAIPDAQRLCYAQSVADYVARCLDQYSVFMVLDGKPEFIQQYSTDGTSEGVAKQLFLEGERAIA